VFARAQSASVMVGASEATGFSGSLREEKGRAPSDGNLNGDLLDGRDSSYFLPRTSKATDADKLDGIDSTGFVQIQALIGKQ
jgi:hypothetical protein